MSKHYRDHQPKRHHHKRPPPSAVDDDDDHIPKHAKKHKHHKHDNDDDNHHHNNNHHHPHPNRRGIAHAGNAFLYHTLGVRPKKHGQHNHEHHQVPDDSILSYDRRQGRYFIVKKGDQIQTAENRRKAWKDYNLTIFSPKSLLLKIFGEGIYLYFDFIRYTTVTNFILTVIMMINIVPHFMYDGFKMSWSPRDFIANFYVSSYGPDSFPYWFWSVVLASFASFCFGPALSLRIKHRFKKHFHYHDHEDKFAHGQDLDVIKDKSGNPKYHKHKNVCRLIISYTLFAGMLFISTVISGAINLAQLTLANTFVFSIALTAFLTISNLLWFKICYWLTMIEGHYTWTAFRKHQTVKFYFWKTINLSTVFISRYIVRVYFDWMVNNFAIYRAFAKANVDLNTQACSLAADAETFLVYIFLEFTAVRFVSVFAPWLMYRLWSVFNKAKAGVYSDKGRPDFDVAEEYLELLYRQYVLYLAMSVIPIAAPLSFLGNLWEYPIDKWVLLNLSKTPPYLRGSMRSFLVFFMFITAFNGLVSFPQGTAWVLAGFNYGEHCPNTIFNYGNGTSIADIVQTGLNQTIGINVPI